MKKFPGTQRGIDINKFGRLLKKQTIVDRRFVVVFLLTLTLLACATNTPVAVAPPQSTRTPFPTFTITPIPPTPLPTATPTHTPLFTDTPTSTPTPVSTDTPTPVPTDVPTNTPVPPTTTPVPPTDTPTPVPPTLAPISPVSTPTPTPPADTPPGSYKEDKKDGERNCAHIGVYGRVVEESKKSQGVPNVTIEVRGNRNFTGPYTAKSDEDGYYTILIAEVQDKVDGVDFTAIVTGPRNVESKKVKWETSDNCEEEDAVQIMEIRWKREK